MVDGQVCLRECDQWSLVFEQPLCVEQQPFA